LDNYIGIDDSPKEIFGKVMSISDDMITKYFTLLTDVPLSEIERMAEDMKGSVNPRDIKIRLAKEIIKTYYSEEAGDKAEEEFKTVFAQKGLPDEIPEYSPAESEIWIVKLLTDSGLCSSSSEVRRLIKGGGLSVDNEKVSDEKYQLSVKDGTIIKAGKRKFLKIVV
ncbi:MAG: tyrosine--tRNA ligase, partial [Spirochaetota bacterium]|nr:tyrosine--tRNA ligase [Spirochaetota bacterium]